MFEIVETTSIPELRLSNTFDRTLTSEQAWEVTFKKWDTLREACRDGKIVADGGRATCGLCALYFYGYSEECEGCPIAQSGHTGCNGTPYENYKKAAASGDLKKALLAAEDEIKFLSGLYPRKEW